MLFVVVVVWSLCVVCFLAPTPELLSNFGLRHLRRNRIKNYVPSRSSLSCGCVSCGLLFRITIRHRFYKVRFYFGIFVVCIFSNRSTSFDRIGSQFVVKFIYLYRGVCVLLLLPFRDWISWREGNVLCLCVASEQKRKRDNHEKIIITGLAAIAGNKRNTQHTHKNIIYKSVEIS